MQQKHLAAVHRLEQQCQAYPWHHWYFRLVLRSRARGWILEKDRQIIGFGIIRIRQARAHILNMCVSPEFRRRGLGRRIMLQLLSVARKQHARQAWLEVRPTNHAAIVLYRKLGFRVIGIRKSYYPARTGRQNAVVMRKRL